MDITEIIDLANETVEVPDHLQKTSAEVRRRVCALKQLQVEAYKAQAAFNAKVYELEAQLAAIYTQIGEKRAAIVNGQYEPSNEEATAPLLHVVERTGLAELEREWNNNNPNRGQVGVPDFWLNVIKGNATFAGMITEQDEPILKHLVDLTYTVDLNPQAFTLIFKFAPNNGYFTNTELTKRYEITTDVDDKEPFFYAGPRCLSIDGTHINWLHGKDVTVDGDGHLQQSVFNFFKVAGKRDGLPESALADFELDYEFGEAIRDQIIPRAVLYYTGEAEEADSDYDSCEEDSDEDSDDEETITIEDMDE